MLKFSLLKSSSIILFLLSIILLLGSCRRSKVKAIKNPNLTYVEYTPSSNDKIIDRNLYYNKVYGFWLGECIANWTGLVTEMDKIGNIGEIKTGDFYTRENWGKPDQPSIWGEGKPSELSENIDFVFEKEDGIWGSDDDTDLEYLYLYLMKENQTSLLTGNQIRDGWLKHIKHDEENYLWVSNQRAFDLMKEGIVPPATGDPKNNTEFEMIDAQLTTEIFGLLSPARPDIARKLALLPIQTTARFNSQWISEFYVTMYSLASAVNTNLSMKNKVLWMADSSRKHLPSESYAAKMYDFVKSKYLSGIPWELTRDSVYVRYQVEQKDGYNITSQNRYCNGCFASGINFASSLVSLFYGEGNFKETIKISILCGWDADNPTSTWGGMLGFMIGRNGIERAFGHKFSNKYNIHRTRQNFPNNGIDTFEEMSKRVIYVTDRVVQEQIGGGVDLEKNLWYIKQ